MKEPPNTSPDDHERDVLGDPTPWARCEPRWTQGIQWSGPETVWEVGSEAVPQPDTTVVTGGGRMFSSERP